MVILQVFTYLSGVVLEEHQPSSNNSVTVEQRYSTIAWLPEKQESWASRWIQ